MRDKLIGNLRCFQTAILVFFIIHGGMFGTGVNILIKVAEEDAWIATLVGSLIGFIPYYLYVSLSIKYPDKNIFEIIETTFGKLVGKIIVFIITIFAMSFILFCFWSLTNLISSQYLYKTPQLFVYIIFSIPLIYILSKGIKITLRSITIIFFITVFLYMITFISLVPQAHLINLYPILKDGLTPVIQASFGFVAYCICPLFFIGAIPVHYYEDKENYKKYMTVAYIIACATIFIIPFLIISIFGIELAQLYQYPEFQILRRVTIGGFIERIESTLSIQWIFELFILITIGIYFIKQSFYHIFCIKNKNLRLGLNGIFLFLFGIATLNVFANNTVANQFSVNQYPYVCYVFLIFFFILYVIISLKKKRN